MKQIVIFTLLLPFFVSCQTTTKKASKEQKAYTVQKTEAEWKAELSPLAFRVLRKAGTERPFTGEYNSFYKDGTYLCKGCNTPIYYSEHKFDSGTGWPSFDRGIEENIEYDVDYKLGYARTEVRCSTCGGHLGHIFNDGPRKTTGKRHCLNSIALEFIPADDDK